MDLENKEKGVCLLPGRAVSQSTRAGQQNSTDWVAYKQQTFISQSLEAGSQQSGGQHGQVWVFFWVEDFSLYPHMVKG